MISGSQRCQPASIKLQVIVIFLTAHSWYLHTGYQQSQILCIFLGVIQKARHLGRGKEQTKKAIKMTQKGGCAVKKVISFTQVILCTFFCNSTFPDNITLINKKNTSKKEPAGMFQITISYLHKNTIFPLLCQSGFFIHTMCV